MKKMIFASVLFCLLFGSCALAGGPVGGVKGIRIPDTARDAGTFVLSGPEFIYTGVEAAWTVEVDGADEGWTYKFTTAKDDHSFLDENISDIQYIVDAGTEPSFSWTCYDPGYYYAFVDVYDGNGEVVGNDWRGFTVERNPDGDILMTRVSEIAAECRTDSEYRTALNIYDWVMDHVTYDDTFCHYTAADGILGGTCVCNGYAKAFTLIAGECGLQSSRVIGVVRNDNGEPDENAGHGWNVVMVDGLWYKLDATWDDGGDHNYFLVDDDLIEVEHCKQKIDIGDVTCDSFYHNYKISEGYWEEMTRPVIERVNEYLNDGDHNCNYSAAELYEGDDQYLYVKYQRHLIGKVAEFVLTYYPFTWWDGTELTEPDYWRTVNYSMEGDDIYNISIWFSTSKVLTLPAGLLSVDEEILSGTGAHIIVVPEGCKSIGDYAFRGVKIWEITLPTSIEYMSEHCLDEMGNGVFYVWSDSDIVWDYIDAHFGYAE